MKPRNFHEKIEPPHWATRFLQWYCAPDLLEEVEGDILEVFHAVALQKGAKKANWAFIAQVFRFFNYSTIKGNRRFSFQQNRRAMFRNYLKVSLRNLISEKLYTAVNIMGLSIGLTCAILIALFVKDEVSYDQFHSKANSIYRLWVKEDHGNYEIYFNTTTPPALGTTLKNELPEAAQVVRIVDTSSEVSQGTFSENEEILLAEEGFFSLFDFQIKHGVVKGVLKQADQIIITEGMAVKYFGTEEVVGKLLTLDFGGDERTFSIAAVAVNTPTNSSIQFNFIISYENFDFISSERQRESWYNVSVETYALLHEKSNVSEIIEKTEAIIKSRLADDYPENGYAVGLQPLTDIHLNNDMPVGIAPVSDWKYSYILGTIAFFILLVAAINFMTLSIGRSFSRAKEVGVRKSIGAQKGQIMLQYWSEAVIIALFAMCLGVVLTVLALPVFNTFTGKVLSLAFTLDNLLLFLGITFFTGLLSGFYPAFILSRFSPIAVLKGTVGKVNTGNKGQHFFRKLMVSVQFILSVTLVAGALIIHQQLNYMQFKDLGFDKEQLIVIPQAINAQGFGDLIEKGFEEGKVLQTQLQNLSEVKDISLSMHSFDQNGWLLIGYRDDQGLMRDFNFNGIDENYLTVHNIELTQGRNFIPGNQNDARRGMLINERMAEVFGWGVGDNPKQFPEFEIIGITKDFHFTSLHTPIAPAMMVMNPNDIFPNINNIEGSTSITPKLTLKLQTGDFANTLVKLENAYQKIYPGALFDFHFVDEALEEMYRREQQMGKILGYATTLALLIAALGLFGLVTLVVQKKAKEIGIRKVLGAPTTSILLQIGKEFLLLVFIALCLATPLTWWIMEQWLADFSERITITPLTFFLAGGIMFLVTILTISYQAFKASKLDPVVTLKGE